MPKATHVDTRITKKFLKHVKSESPYTRVQSIFDREKHIMGVIEYEDAFAL